MNKIIIPLLLLVLVSCKEETEKKSVGSNDNEEINNSEYHNTEETTSIEDSIENTDEKINLLVFDNAIRAYINDLDNEPTNIRLTPGGEIVNYFSDELGYEVMLLGVADGWFYIGSVWCPDNEDESTDNMNAYVHGSVLALSTRNYGGETINIYSEPNDSSEVVDQITSEIQLRLTSANKSGSWIKVYYSKNGTTTRGWIEKKWVCGSLVTTCS